MIRYETKEDKHNNIKNAIMVTDKNTGTSIYIDVLTITNSTEENHSNYQIKHGNYFPKIIEDGEVKKATWDQFYIDGKDDGYPDGFMSLDDIENFINQEIEKIRTKITESIISNDYKTQEGVDSNRWNLVLEAWLNFREKFSTAKENHKLIGLKEAKNLQKTLLN